MQGDQRGGRGEQYCPNNKHYFPAAILCSSLSQVMFLAYIVIRLYEVVLVYPKSTV
jgi:hypothetical protein